MAHLHGQSERSSKNLFAEATQHQAPLAKGVFRMASRPGFDERVAAVMTFKQLKEILHLIRFCCKLLLYFFSHADQAMRKKLSTFASFRIYLSF